MPGTDPAPAGAWPAGVLTERRPAFASARTAFSGSGDKAAASHRSWRLRASLLVKLLLSLALLGIAVAQIDLQRAARTIGMADPLLLAAAYLLLLQQPVLGAWRWRNIISGLAGRLPFPASLRFLFIATFFNQVLPGAVVGDGVRAFLARGTGLSWRQAANSVLIDRLTMLAIIVLLVLAVEPWVAERLGYGAQPWLLPTALALALLALLVLVFPRQLLGPLYTARRLGPVRDLLADTRRLFLKPGPLLLLLLSCLLSYANMGVVFWLAGSALDLGLGASAYLFVVPPVVLASILPISVGGWGVREAAAVALFAAAGAEPSAALATSVVFGLLSMAVGAPGLAIWLLHRKTRRSADAAEADPPPAAAR